MCKEICFILFFFFFTLGIKNKTKQNLVQLFILFLGVFLNLGDGWDTNFGVVLSSHLGAECTVGYDGYDGHDHLS